jgi:hypothetical protein
LKYGLSHAFTPGKSGVAQSWQNLNLISEITRLFPKSMSRLTFNSKLYQSQGSSKEQALHGLHVLKAYIWSACFPSPAFNYNQNYASDDVTLYYTFVNLPEWPLFLHHRLSCVTVIEDGTVLSNFTIFYSVGRYM